MYINITNYYINNIIYFSEWQYFLNLWLFIREFLFEWKFKYNTKNVNGHFIFSIIILVKFDRNYITYTAVLPIAERKFWKMGKHLNLSQRILIESNLNEILV